MKKKTLSIIIAIVTCLSAFAVTACSKEETFEEKVAKGNGDLVIATVTVRNEKTDRVMFEEKLFTEENNSLTVPTRSYGATFLGYTDKGGIEVFDDHGVQAENVLITKDITLYARFNYEACTIRFNANGGTIYGSSDDIHLYYMDDVSTFPTAEKEGFIFRGWKDAYGNLVSDSQGIPKNEEFNADNYYIDSSYTCNLAAYFEEYKPTVTFDYGNGRVETTTVSYNGYVTTPESVDTGSRMIVGWSDYMNTDPNDATMAYNKPITNETTIYAIWDSYKTVNIVLYDEDNPDSVLYRGTMKIFTKKDTQFPTAYEMGYNYDGIAWYTNQSRSGNSYVDTPRQDNTATTFYGFGYYY